MPSFPLNVSLNISSGTSLTPFGIPAHEKADAIFAHTAAHEIGHEILAAYGGDYYSYSHRGSSTLNQKRRALGKGGERFPLTGEIDLMKYYHGAWPRDFYRRSLASEHDVKGLLYLAGMEVDQSSALL